MTTDHEEARTPIAPRPSAFLERALVFIGRWEGNEPSIYKDSKGNLTVGIGNKLPYLETALLLPFTPHQFVESDYAAVRALPANMLPSFYRPHTRCTLSAGAIRDLFAARCAEFEAQYPRELAVHTFPEPARLGLLDMTFNMGTHAVMGWPEFGVGLRSRNFMVCAQQSHRHDVSEARNQAVKDLFIEAAAQTRSA